MELVEGRHLGYCTNIHRGEDWAETLAALQRHTGEVRRRVCHPDKPYGIGLRLSAKAAAELETDQQAFTQFRHWLDESNSYIFTINGFPYGDFHRVRVKEQVFRPDWTTQDRYDYTERLFRLLVRLEPPGREGSVSTLPASHKTFEISQEQQAITRRMFAKMANFLDDLSEESGNDLHLGVEPEPLGLFETTPETIDYLETLCGEARDESIIRRRIGVNFDTCHLALQYENVADSLRQFHASGIRVSKIHLSSALKFRPTAIHRKTLKTFHDEVYLHQIIIREDGKPLRRFIDLPDVLPLRAEDVGEEWRVHFHVPLHTSPGHGLEDTRSEVLAALDVIAADTTICRHLEMETYTWEVLPSNIRASTVEDQLENEYRWCLHECEKRNITRL